MLKYNDYLGKKHPFSLDFYVRQFAVLTSDNLQWYTERHT